MSGGKLTPKGLSYDTPKGPTSQSHTGPGLGGDNYGNGQQPYCRERESGSVGLGGTNHGNAPGQGRH